MSFLGRYFLIKYLQDIKNYQITDMKIIFCHLLNDYSGSPKILRKTMQTVSTLQWGAKLYYGGSQNGFLAESDIPSVCYWYKRSNIKLLTFITFLLSQMHLFAKLIRDRTIDKDAVVYVNTILPFGGALFGKITNRKVIYHIHEISIRPVPLKWLLLSIARWTSNLNIYVSNTHMTAFPISNVQSTVLYNALENEFAHQAASHSYSPDHNGYFNVLMIASLRDYKGIPEFLALAENLAEEKALRFHLVLNDDEKAISVYMQRRKIPVNLSIHDRTPDVSSYYRFASVLVNLSRTDIWIETFGMTILEAMAYGIPVIVPPVGGPRELVADGVQGFLVDSRNGQLLSERVMKLYSDPQLCERMSRAGRERAADFSTEVFTKQIMQILGKVRNRNA